jgi:predicted CoA-substrate-specific enzyme activase
MTAVVFGGVDIGASTTKVVLIDKNKEILAYDVRPSGHDFVESARKGWEAALTSARVLPSEVVQVFSTGYGRHNVDFAGSTKTEISCHANGCYYYYPTSLTIVDIGGQDNKIIKLNDQGARIGFKMNRKCAAGTGAFLEEMAHRLTLPLDELDAYARRSTHEVTINSYCTVFGATEVLGKIRMGTPVADIIRGLFRSVVKRVLEMDTLTEKVALTGGVAEHNAILVEIFQEEIGKNVLLPPHPQLTGAFGAALYSMDHWYKVNS